MADPLPQAWLAGRQTCAHAWHGTGSSCMVAARTSLKHAPPKHADTSSSPLKHLQHCSLAHSSLCGRQAATSVAPLHSFLSSWLCLFTLTFSLPCGMAHLYWLTVSSFCLPFTAWQQHKTLPPPPFPPFQQLPSPLTWFVPHMPPLPLPACASLFLYSSFFFALSLHYISYFYKWHGLNCIPNRHAGSSPHAHPFSPLLSPLPLKTFLALPAFAQKGRRGRQGGRSRRRRVGRRQGQEGGGGDREDGRQTDDRLTNCG